MNNEGNETFMTRANHWISEKTRKRLGAIAFQLRRASLSRETSVRYISGRAQKKFSDKRVGDNNFCGICRVDRPKSLRDVHFSICCS